ncbi:MAG: MFS transporter [Dehalococcoidia bacterium]|nr:MFS transporter [Dehalococcoidia bacterium]
MQQRTTGWGRLPRLHTLDSWAKYRNYRFLWTANFCANSAQWLQLLTLGWLVHDLTVGSSSSPFQVITVGGLVTLPVLLVGPWAGVLGDRVDRRKLLMATHTALAAVAAVFALLVATDRVQESWHVYVYALVSGSFRTIAMPTQQSLIANTVPRESLVNAYAINVFTIPGTRIMGPFVGGILIATLGFTWNFAIEAALYATAVFVLLWLHTPYRQTATAVQQSPLSSLKEGIGYVWKGERVIFNLVILGLIPNVLLHPVWFLIPIFTSDVLDKGADFGGYLVATTGLGGFISALTIASVGFIFRKGMVCLVAAGVSSVFNILFARSEWLVLSFIILGLMAFSQGTFRTTNGALIQLLAPDAMRGRITSIQNYSQGFVPFSSLLIGLFAWHTNSAPLASTVVGIVGVALSGLFFITYHKVRQLE